MELSHGPGVYKYSHKSYSSQSDSWSSRVSLNSWAAPVVGAIFGLGRAGSIHLSNIIGNPRVILKYIVDDRSERFAELKDYWKLDNSVTFLTSKDSEKVYKDKSVNVVFIGSPTWTHEDIVVNSINNNKHVYCEKPIAENIEDTKKCYETAKAKGCTLFAAFNRRFDPAYSGLWQRVRNGDVGHVQILKVTARDSPLPSIPYLQTSGGVFHDCLVHDFDMACWVLGELPTRVQATAAALIPEVKEGIKQTPIFYSFPSRYRLAYKYELEHFLDVVMNGEPMKVTSWQTLAVSKIATAAEKSARTGQTVELDWTKDGIPAIYS
ncbi:putative oxidoreductase yrbE [Operophtera brumata]|uniref:Putative oxidoreductase yrbE n=1 Tax=Operophtera brumata TaxID=104452 RepID=A0A0L7LTB5_OPEBR|nr:putative oxidoreductase yrbE [Operophtera brumata]